VPNAIEFIPNQPHQDTLHLIDRHIDVLDHTPVEHSSRNVPVTAFLLKFTEAPQDNAFPVRETVSDIGYMVI
jgi:hypothetical protein